MTVDTNEKKIKELEARLVEIERFHYRGAAPLLAYHNPAPPPRTPVINPEFMAEDTAANKAREERLKAHG